MSAALTFAFGAGLLATVNPCGFVMLPSFLSLYMGSGDTGERSLLARSGQGFRVGLALTAGFAAVYVIAGLIISIGLRSFVHVVPWVAIVIAVVLIGLGAAMVFGAHIGLTAASRVAVDGRKLSTRTSLRDARASRTATASGDRRSNVTLRLLRLSGSK